jgi:hypothetical protein
LEQFGLAHLEIMELNNVGLVVHIRVHIL